MIDKYFQEQFLESGLINNLTVNFKGNGLKNYFLKIIKLFGYSSSRILIISANETDFRACLENYPEKLISHVSPEQNNAITLLKDCFRTEKYDLLILDRIWDEKDKISENLWELIKYNFSRNGQIICLAGNKLNLRRPATCLKSLFNFLLRGKMSPFAGYYSNQIKTAGYSHIKRFYLVPDLDDFNHLISDNRRATLEFMKKSRGFTRVFPKNPRNWLKWIFVWLGGDSWLVSTHLFWGRK